MLSDEAMCSSMAEKGRNWCRAPHRKPHEMGQRRFGQRAEEGRILLREHDFEFAAADILVLCGPSIEPIDEGRDRRIGGDAAVELMEAAFAGERDETRARQFERAPVGVEVQQAPARHVEAFLAAAKHPPNLAPQKQAVRLAQGPEPSRIDGPSAVALRGTEERRLV
jgi:hypothetical protein